MADPLVPLTSIGTSLLATGIATGATVTADEVKQRLRRRRVSKEVGDLATEFSEALETAIREEQTRLVSEEATRALDPVTDIDWRLVVKQLADDEAAPDADSRQEREEISVLFEDEADAVAQITTALCAVCEELETAIEHTADLRQTVENAVGRAYRKAVAEFERRLANDDELAALFKAETDLEVLERVDGLQERLTAIDGALGAQLSQAARDEGFVRLSPTLFDRLAPTDEAAWRTTFSLADVHAGIPAERTGHEDGHTASDELLAALRASENRMVTGQPGSGKSTLCKQVALDWYRHPETGAVLYREYGRGGRAFESVGSLADTVETAEGHTLVVVEHAPRERTNAIARFVTEYAGAANVTILLDARESELDRLADESLDNSAGQRAQKRGLLDVPRYQLPAVTVVDIERAIVAFEAATGRRVGLDAKALHDKVAGGAIDGAGAFLLLAFYFPVGERNAQTGLEGHVRDRYRAIDPGDTQYDPGKSAPKLSNHDPDLVADIGAMVAILSTTGIGIYPELVAGLVVGDTTDGWDALDRVTPILDSLNGWLMFESPDTGGAPYVMHELWATLYLRELACDHADEYDDSDFGDRSEPRVGRCLDALFRLCDDPTYRESLYSVVSGSAVLGEMVANPEPVAAGIVEAVIELGRHWPALAPLLGTTASALYELPETLSDHEVCWVITNRGHAHRDRGDYDKANKEYKRRLRKARKFDDPKGEAKSLRNLGGVASRLGYNEAARKYHQQSLKISRALGDQRGEAASLRDLGNLAKKLNEYEAAGKYHQQSLEIFRDTDDQRGEAASLGDLGNLARKLNKYEAAGKYHQQSLEMFRDIGDQRGEAACLGNLGNVARSVGEYEAARKYHQQSLKISRDLGHRSGEAKSLLNLGNVAYEVDEYDDAQDRFEAARDTFAGLGAVHHELTVRENLVKLERAVDAPIRARKRCEDALARLDGLDREFPEERGWFAEVLGELNDAADSGD